jgi:glycine zipper 2TM protein
MVPVNSIRKAVSAALVATTLTLQPVSAVAAADQSRHHRQEDRRDYDRRYDDRSYARAYRPEWRNYDYRHFEPGERRYDAARYYLRDDGRYRTRRLYRNDRIYRGMDDRYYCRRDDGTTGLIVGGIAGGVLGNIIAPGGSKTLGTIIGAGAGAVIGREIDRGDVECR